MKMLHPDGKQVCDVNPADAEDEATLKANGWKPLKGAKPEAEPAADAPVAAKPEPKAPKAAKAKAPKPE
jgi:hypothetical protein